jgi:hypothetical protein
MAGWEEKALCGKTEKTLLRNADFVEYASE